LTTATWYSLAALPKDTRDGDDSMAKVEEEINSYSTLHFEYGM
jgi:hypothetical protein